MECIFCCSVFVVWIDHSLSSSFREREENHKEYLRESSTVLVRVN